MSAVLKTKTYSYIKSECGVQIIYQPRSYWALNLGIS
jgi:hypothetical protein